MGIYDRIVRNVYRTFFLSILRPKDGISGLQGNSAWNKTKILHNKLNHRAPKNPIKPQLEHFDYGWKKQDD